MKKCKKCEIEKPLCDFYRNKRRGDGLESRCITSIKKKQAEYRLKNKDKLKEKREKNKEEINEKALKYYHDNRDERLIKMKRYRDNNKEKIKDGKVKYRKNNKEKIREYSNTYYENNKEKILEYNRKRNKDNPHIVGWRSVLKSYFRRLGKKKEGSTIDLLGYSATELKDHLEKQFTDGMSWENYGEWHIDHIRPLSSFPPDTPPHIVNALSNLQPLWATTREINGIIYEGNLNKNGRYEE